MREKKVPNTENNIIHFTKYYNHFRSDSDQQGFMLIMPVCWRKAYRNKQLIEWDDGET